MLKFSEGTWNAAASTLSPTDVRVNCMARRGHLSIDELHAGPSSFLPACSSAN